MKTNLNDLVSSCFEYVSNNANSIFRNKMAYLKEKYRIQHNFSNYKNYQTDKTSIALSREEQSLIDRVRSLILVKTNQYTGEGLILPKLMICSAFL